MIAQHCIGPDVDRSRISADAEISGASYLTGRRTAVGPGAVVRDSRLHDAVVEGGAKVVDSIFVTEGEPRVRKADPAGRVLVAGTKEPLIAASAEIAGCTLINSSVAERTRVRDTWGSDCRFGPDNVVEAAKFAGLVTQHHVTITGPTEISGGWLGHHTTIDRRGYHQGIYSNTFRQLKFNESAGRLEIVGTIDLPHVSLYGTNTVNSSNSGKLLPQPGGVLRGFGPHVRLWHDPLLSHERFELGPCCWVAPWTKVIGQSPTQHASNEEMINDELFTYVSPFAVAGYRGELTRGMTMPGELSVGLGPKQRTGAWAFTYAPDAVIRMVARLHEALEPGRKHIADTIVPEAQEAALEITKAMAARHRVDLAAPVEKQPRGWPRWIATTYALLTVHLTEKLWPFKDGRPVEWRQENGRWTHPRIGRLLEIAPDALAAQVTEEQMMAVDDPVPPVRVPVPAGTAGGTGGQPQIDAAAMVASDAFVGPGCRIGPGTTIAAGAAVWNSVLEHCDIGPGARIERSILARSSVGRAVTVRSCCMTDSVIGEDSTANAAVLVNTRLARQARVTAFADLKDVRTDYGTILGGLMHSADIGTYLMSMHMAGACRHLRVIPTLVEIAGRRVGAPAIPMLGGGSIIRGTEDAPVEMECCFIGSNAIVEPNTYVAFGCFVQGVLGPDAGLLPLTVSTGAGVERHQIGAALEALASTVITHFINWTYQALGPRGAEAAAEITRQSIQRGLRAVQWELARRRGEVQPTTQDYSRYRSLPQYSPAQLESGLRTYRRALDCGAWDVVVRNGQLWFASETGHWQERGGSAFWRPSKVRRRE